MPQRLNGWRRLGIVMVLLWIITFMAITFIEYSSKSDGYFVQQSIPIGTVFEGNKITLPDGKIIVVTEEDEFNLRFKLEKNLDKSKAGQPPNPWAVDWTQLTSIPKIAEIRWQRLSLFGLLVPLIAWLIIEVTVFTLAWVRRGF